MKCLFYAGCNTDEYRQGIYSFVVDCDTGEFSQIGTAIETVDPIYLALNKAKTLLYSVETDPDLPAESNGCAVCYRLDGEVPRPVSRTRLEVPIPCYCALSDDERQLAWVDYRTAEFGVSLLNPDGTFQKSVCAHRLRNLGNGPSSPRQDSAHTHCAEFAPDNLLYVTDLGTDEILCATLSNDKFALLPKRSLKCRAGSGPRHILFHPSKPVLFLICELDNTVEVYSQVGTDRFMSIGCWPTLPVDFTGTSKCAALRISEDGSHLFASNRGHDSIAVFHIHDDGSLDSPVISRLNGSFPRDFELLPGEKFVVVGHKKSNEIQMYELDKITGVLSAIHHPFPVHRPLVFKTGRTF